MRLSKEKIKVLLADRGMRVKDLAEAVGMLPNNFSTLLNHRTCQTVTAGKIAKALSVSVAEIVEENE